MISDAAKEVRVENHVLRYWEEELKLPIHRNESGHRIYSQEDVERFKQIKNMKEKGLQLKAIYTLLKKGGVKVQAPGEDCLKGMVKDEDFEEQDEGLGKTPEEQTGEMRIGILAVKDKEGQLMSTETSTLKSSEEDKLQRLQWLMNQVIQKSLEETLPETLHKALEGALEQHNRKLCTDVRESLLKELDYQFRMQTEREEERDKVLQERNEIYYAQIDELLRRKKSKKKRRFVF